MDIGLISEGPTDHGVIENMLCGMLNKDDPGDFIQQLQPNNADAQTYGDGGWYQVFDYIGKADFRGAFGFLDYLVIQIDTDVAGEKHFDVDLRDDSGKTLKCAMTIAQRVKQRLIEQINKVEPQFYQQHSERIIFAISVHSIEIWLFKHFYNKVDKNQQINSGERLLAQCLAKKGKKYTQFFDKQGLIKNYDNYVELSEDFYKPKTASKAIKQLVSKDKSFELFYQQVMSALNKR